MNKQTITILASVGLALLAVVMHAPALWAAPPLSQVILESDSWPALSEYSKSRVAHEPCSPTYRPSTGGTATRRM